MASWRDIFARMNEAKKERAKLEEEGKRLAQRIKEAKEEEQEWIARFIAHFEDRPAPKEDVIDTFSKPIAGLVSMNDILQETKFQMMRERMTITRETKTKTKEIEDPWSIMRDMAHDEWCAMLEKKEQDARDEREAKAKKEQEEEEERVRNSKGAVYFRYWYDRWYSEEDRIAFWPEYLMKYGWDTFTSIEQQEEYKRNNSNEDEDEDDEDEDRRARDGETECDNCYNVVRIRRNGNKWCYGCAPSEDEDD